MKAVCTLLALPLLGACATDSYWYQPPAAGHPASLSTAGTWQGLMREDFGYRISHGALAGAVGVRCARYQDLLRLDVTGGQMEVSLGAEPVLNFSTRIDVGGRFRHQMPVQGDTWIYGGVGLYHNDPTLTFWGQLDPRTGIGQGHLSVTPGSRERLGCYGSFQVSQNAGPPIQEYLQQPFRIQYWIDEVDKSDNNDSSILLNR